MRLGRTRIVLTVLYGLVSALAVMALAVVAIHIGSTRIDQSFDRGLETTLAELLAGRMASSEGPFPTSDGAWLVHPVDGTSEPLGKPRLEPPLLLIAERADKATTFYRFSQDGNTYVAHARSIGTNNTLVVADDAGGVAADKSSLRWRVLLFAAFVVAAASAAGWFVAGRSLRPARRALADQQAFLADAAHEMRTPLAVILASATQALTRSRGGEEYVRSLAEIRAAAERASGGVNELLELSRLDAGQVMPRLAPLRLDLLAEEVAAASRVDECVVEAERGPMVVVDADMALLRQALDNVVRNATRRADKVILRTRRDGRDGVLEVVDDGPGFDPDALAHVFDRFRRGDERGSAGLGLAIVKAILAAHGGAVEAVNRAEGGAMVTFRVPLNRHSLDS
jgi:two-component system OmpR family sensor kinase